MRLRNNERLPAPDLPAAALESWACSAAFSFSLPLPASCDNCLKTGTYIRTDLIIADTDAFVKPANRNTANCCVGGCPQGNPVCICISLWFCGIVSCAGNNSGIHKVKKRETLRSKHNLLRKVFFNGMAVHKIL